MGRPEFKLIEWIRSRVVDRGSVSFGIGDDAAVLRFASDHDVLMAMDMLMEGVHFDLPPATPQLVGRKALAVNLSDIAAMGGRATSAFVSVAIPNDRGMDFAKDLHAGLLELADEYDVVLAGGDTNSWSGPLVINVAVVGEPITPQPILRSGAQPGDWLFVTGALGGSLPSGRHLQFTPRLREVRLLLGLAEIHAMLDVSDGLAADLHHMLDQSHVGAVLESDRIPISVDACRFNNNARTPLQRALSDGEDFELLFAVAPCDGRRLEECWNDQTPITRIGQITNDAGCWLRADDGTIAELPPLGWTHSI